MSRFYITTAIDYVNSRPHLGTAYEKVCADVIARYKRLTGVETWFVMGNDEHSQNVYKSAMEQGLDPLAYCDRMEEMFQKTWRALDLSYDDFIRTSQPRHKVAVTEMVQRIHDAGDIYEGVYEGWYCVGCEAFKPEKELVDGRCPLHPNTDPQWIKEKNYFFRLSKYQQPLLDWFARNPDFSEPDARRNEQLRLVESGLEDISISRAGQSWGIPLPWDQGSVVYVWFDALINYAAAVGLGTDRERCEKWWPADLHVIGKDITRFHTVIWPAMLMSAKLPLPRKVFAHGFMTFAGQRMSKSNPGTIVDPLDAAQRHGVDPLRLYLTKEIVFGSDGDFSWERFDERYNSDLANNLGNLVSRVTAMAHQYRQGRLAPTGETSARLKELSIEVAAAYRHAMDTFAIHEAVASVFRLIDATNLHIAETTPWVLAKHPSKADQLTQVLFDAAEAVRLAAVLLSPFMPASSREILRRVGRSSDSLRLDRDGRWTPEGERILVQDAQLWPRFDAKKPKERSVPENPEPRTPEPAPRTTEPAPSTQNPAPGTERISIDDFKKVELRTAKVIAAEAVPKSKKLIKLQVDLGTEQRTILAGIAEAYQPESLVGRTIVIVANLKPAKLMGIESNGMVLAASSDTGLPVLLTVDAEPGWLVR
ncbi:MAG TPA: methionine--tRNA ligase [Vicinamibacterales bacterium]|nr:methionine--tRNA ligase [Vicinamibacterales bacterium]